MVAATTVTISGYDNEDIVYPFAIQTGDVNSPSPFSLTGYDLEADIVDSKTFSSVLRLTTNEGDHRITIADAVNGLISIKIEHGAIPFNAKQKLQYDLLLKSQADGTFRRLFGGTVQILEGCTTPA